MSIKTKNEAEFTKEQFSVKPKGLYTLYDSKSETYSNPFTHNSLGDAIRSFTDAVNTGDPKSLLVAHPEDFTLFHIGNYNEVNGSIEGISKQAIGNGVDFKQALQPTPIESAIAQAS